MASFLSLLAEGPIGNVICLHMTEESICNLGIVTKSCYDVIVRYMKPIFNERYDLKTFDRIGRDDYSFWASMLTNFSIAKGDLVEAMFLMDDSDIDVFKVCVDECIARGMNVGKLRRKKHPRSKDKVRCEKFGGKYSDFHPGTVFLECHLMFTNRVVLHDYIRDKLCHVEEDEIVRRLRTSCRLFCDEIVNSFIPYILKQDLIKTTKGGGAFDNRGLFNVTDFRRLPLTVSTLAPLLSPKLIHDFITFFMMIFNHRSIEIMEKHCNLPDEEKRRISLYRSNIEAVSKLDIFLMKTTKGRFWKVGYLILRGT